MCGYIDFVCDIGKLAIVQHAVSPCILGLDSSVPIEKIYTHMVNQCFYVTE